MLTQVSAPVVWQGGSIFLAGVVLIDAWSVATKKSSSMQETARTAVNHLASKIWSIRGLRARGGGVHPMFGRHFCAREVLPSDVVCFAWS